LPQYFTRGESMATIPFTNQVLVFEPEMQDAHHAYAKFLSMLFNQYPQLLTPEGRIAPRDVPDPLRRGIFEAIGHDMAKRLSSAAPSPPALYALVSDMVLQATERHEAIHIAQWLRKVIPGNATQLNLAAIEVNGVVGENTNGPGTGFVTLYQISAAGTFTEDDFKSNQHSKDLVYARNRRFYFIWKDTELRKRLKIELPGPTSHRPIHVFSDLAEDIQLGVIHNLSKIDDEGWKTINNQVWNELQLEDNPFKRNEDIEVLSYPPTEYTSYWVMPGIPIEAGIAAVILRWYQTRRKVDRNAPPPDNGNKPGPFGLVQLIRRAAEFMGRPFGLSRPSRQLDRAV